MPTLFPIVLATVLMLSTGLSVCAQARHNDEQPLQEVFQTELVYPQEQGEVQLTLTPMFARRHGERRFSIPLALEYGLTDAWQVLIEWEGYTRRESDTGAVAYGPGDVRIGTKYSLMHIAGSNFHSAVGLEIGFPTGHVDKGLSEGFIEYEPFVLLAQDFPKLNNLQLFAQIGFGLVQRLKIADDPDEVEPAAHEFNLHTGFFLPYRQARFTGELVWSTNKWNHGGKESTVYLTPGLVWKFPGKWELGVGVPVGLHRDADDFGVIVKLTYEFALFPSGHD